ncbi:MAG TPA: sulfatase/phosphatase domain-containing protein, partial [Planctomycetota bacterium]|nr:sulfatase/phosphatase domain-containing protein [Planctomycetota bacterium]
ERRQVAWRDAVYYHYYESQATHRVPAMYGVRTATHMLVRYYEPQWNCEELFDLVADPDERQNVVADPAHAGVLAALQKRLAALRAEYGDDTGELGGGAFTHVAGIARAVRDGDGWRVWANAVGGFLLHTTEPARRVRVAATMRSVAAKPLRNGFLVVRGDSGNDTVRAGIELGARKLVLLMPGARTVRVDAAIEWDGKSAIEVELDIDLDAGRVVVKAAGQELRAELAAKWQAITAQGYGASNTETWFGELRRAF